jgi:hypothetical protein
VSDEIRVALSTGFVTFLFSCLVLHKAGRHMEDTLIASYVTLIIGYLIIEDKVCRVKLIFTSTHVLSYQFSVSRSTSP